MNFEDKKDKSRRFEFLLNNLVEKKGQESEVMVSNEGPALGCQKISEKNQGNLYTGNYDSETVYQPRSGYQYKPIFLSGG